MENKLNIDYGNLVSTIKHFENRYLLNKRKCDKLKEDLDILREVKRFLDVQKGIFNKE